MRRSKSRATRDLNGACPRVRASLPRGQRASFRIPFARDHPTCKYPPRIRDRFWRPPYSRRLRRFRLLPSAKLAILNIPDQRSMRPFLIRCRSLTQRLIGLIRRPSRYRGINFSQRRRIRRIPTRLHSRAPPLCMFLHYSLIRNTGQAKIVDAATLPLSCRHVPVGVHRAQCWRNLENFAQSQYL